MDYPVEVERTQRAIYWRLPNGSYVATSTTTILPPKITSGGYNRLDSLKKLKGDN